MAKLNKAINAGMRDPDGILTSSAAAAALYEIAKETLRSQGCRIVTRGTADVWECILHKSPTYDPDGRWTGYKPSFFEVTVPVDRATRPHIWWGATIEISLNGDVLPDGECWYIA